MPQLNIMILWQFARLTTSASEIKVYNLSGEEAVSPIGQCVSYMLYKCRGQKCNKVVSKDTLQWNW